MANQLSTYEEVIELVKRWPVVQQQALLRELRRSIEMESPHATNHSTLGRARGLLRQSHTSVSDQAIKTMLEERHLRHLDT